MKTKGGRYNIRVLDRAFRVLDLLSDGTPRTLTEISHVLELNSSSVFRLLATLEDHSYIRRNENSNAYQLGLSCLELARAYFDGNDIRRSALPDLEVLRDMTSETVHLGILDEMQVVYLEKLHGLHAIGLMISRVGGRAPAYCTGLGKALLAYLPSESVRRFYEESPLYRFTENTIESLDELLEHLEEIRSNGYSLDRGEHEHEVRCVAAPIFDISGRAVAAISVSGPATRMEPLDEQEQLIANTLDVASRISGRLGYQG